MTQRTHASPVIRRAAVGSAAFLAAGLLLAGCGVLEESSTPSPPADPKETLLAAVPDEEAPAFRFSGTDTDGMPISGAVDPTNNGSEMVVTMSEDVDGVELNMTLSVRTLDQDIWMQMDFGETTELYGLLGVEQDQWMELDQSKLTDDSLTYDIADVGNTKVIMNASDDVQQHADGSYTGTVDLTDKPRAAQALFGEGVTALDEAAAPVPFTAMIGADGNLETLSVELPAVGEQPAGEYLVKYFDYGDVPSITPPTGDVMPASDEVYEWMG